MLDAISKKFFHPTRQRRTSLGVEPSSQILDMLEYACGLILGLSLISNENPNFDNGFLYSRSFFYFHKQHLIAQEIRIGFITRNGFDQFFR